MYGSGCAWLGSGGGGVRSVEKGSCCCCCVFVGCFGTGCVESCFTWFFGTLVLLLVVVVVLGPVMCGSGRSCLFFSVLLMMLVVSRCSTNMIKSVAKYLSLLGVKR